VPSGSSARSCSNSMPFGSASSIGFRRLPCPAASFCRITRILAPCSTSAIAGSGLSAKPDLASVRRMGHSCAFFFVSHATSDQYAVFWMLGASEPFLVALKRRFQWVAGPLAPTVSTVRAFASCLEQAMPMTMSAGSELLGRAAGGATSLYDTG
jgi:hypothetical protein